LSKGKKFGARSSHSLSVIRAQGKKIGARKNIVGVLRA